MTTPSQTIPAVRGNEELCALLDAASQEVFRLMVGTERPLRRGVISAGGSVDA